MKEPVIWEPAAACDPAVLEVQETLAALPPLRLPDTIVAVPR